MRTGLLYLLLAVLAGSSMTIALRYFQKEEGNRYGLLLGNYITCVVLAFLLLPQKQLLPEGVKTTLLCGIADGVLFVVSLLLMQTNIRKNGAVLTAAFSRLGLLVPLAYGIFILRERPGVLQIIGILLVFAALVILNFFDRDKKEEKKKSGGGSLALLLLLLVFFGAGDTMAKVFEQVGSRGQDELFFFYVFLTALVLCCFLAVREKSKTGQKVLARDLAAGIAVGIPNYFSSALLLKSLVRLPAFLVYPCVSTGTIAAVTLVSTLLFREKISRAKWTGLAVIAAALVLLNI